MLHINDIITIISIIVTDKEVYWDHWGESQNSSYRGARQLHSRQSEPLSWVPNWENKSLTKLKKNWKI